MASYASLDDVARVVETNSGVKDFTMQELRDAYGVKKLGVHVRGFIVDELAGRGCLTLPSSLPEYQHEQVIVYKQGTDIARVIEAISRPSQSSADVLRDLLQGDNAKQKLKRIAAIVDE